MADVYLQALRLYDGRRPDLAERLVRRFLEAQPGHAGAHALMALCRRRHGRGVEAMRWAEEALRLDPALPFAHYARAVALVERKRLGVAEAAIGEAIRLAPDRTVFHFLLAAIRTDRRDHRGALDAVERGLRLDPEHSGCASLRALILQRLGRDGEVDAAIAAALARAPDSDYTHAAWAWALLHRGERSRARAHFREALRINAENRWAQAGLRACPPRRAIRAIAWAFGASAAVLWGVGMAVLAGQMLWSLGLVDRDVSLSPGLVICVQVASFALVRRLFRSCPDLRGR